MLLYIVMRDKIITFLEEIEDAFPPSGNARHSISLYGSTNQLVLNVRVRSTPDTHFLDESDFENTDRLITEIEKVINGKNG